ncbi:MAG TPA: hypothetical protein VFJ14_09550 [Nocardioidaceae bacterium]|nr:hypothetical protein [Nocardioidaceae bacterium]
MGAVWWLVLGLVQLVLELRRYGEPGRERYRRLSDRRAAGVHDLYVSRTIPFLNTGAVALSVVGGVLATIEGSVVWAALWAAAAVLLLASLAVRTRVKPTVLAEFDARGLPPLVERHRSLRRERRQVQFGVVTLVAFLVGEVATYLADRWDQPAWDVAAAISLLVAIIAAVALVWSTVWVYGDEQRP